MSGHADYDDFEENPFAEAALQNEQQEAPIKPSEDNTAVEAEVVKSVATEIQNDNAETVPNEMVAERTHIKYRLIVKVTGIERVGSSTNKKENPTVVFDIQTDLPTFRKKLHKSIKKTMNELQNLFDFLIADVPECFVPALPLPYTSYGANNKEDTKKMIKTFQAWFDRICDNPLILKNEELAFCIESDHSTYFPINKTNTIVSGLKRKTLKQLSPPYDESVDLAEFRPLVKAIYWNSQEIRTKFLKVCKNKRMLSQYENQFGRTFIMLGELQEKTSESMNTALVATNNNEYEKLVSKQSRLNKNFGKVMKLLGDINSIITTFENATLNDNLEYLSNETYNVKETLTNRHLSMRELTQLQTASASKKEQLKKLKSRKDSNPIKVDESMRSYKDATRQEQNLTLKLHRITNNMLIEKEQWIEWYENQIKATIKEFALRKIEFERKKLSMLEKMRHEVRNADPSGGLSRLGRETALKQKNINRSNSQDANGDDWTGDYRPHAKTKISNPEISKIADISEPQTVTSLDAKSAATLLGKCTF